MNSRTQSILAVGFALFATQLFSQTNYLNTVTTAVPFLLVNNDAVTSALGDANATSLNDQNSIFSNAAKYALNSDTSAFALNFRTPADEFHSFSGSASASYKWNPKNTVSAGMRYFSYSSSVNPILPFPDFNPAEYSIDLAYSRKISENFGAAVTGKYIHSHVALFDSVSMNVVNTSDLAFDVSGIYKRRFDLFSHITDFWAGASISNIGDKMSYTNTVVTDFIPTNLKLGISLEVHLNEKHSLTILSDINKLLVPTPSVEDEDLNGIYDYQEQSTFSGMFHSFSDAPNGFEEEIKEITLSEGVQYNFDDKLFVRGGYFYESPEKGGRQFLTTGLGVTYWKLQGDIAYLIPVDSEQDNCLTISLSVNFN